MPTPKPDNRHDAISVAEAPCFAGRQGGVNLALTSQMASNHHCATIGHSSTPMDCADQRVKPLETIRAERKFMTRMKHHLALATAAMLALSPLPPEAASLYVPLQDHYLNGRIEQLAVLAEAPVMRKPYNVREVERWLTSIRSTYPGLHAQISQGLKRYQESGLSQANLTLAASDTEHDAAPLPNARGEQIGSEYRIDASANWQATSWLTGTLGLQARAQPQEIIPLDSYLAIGGDDIQLDIGYRERWLSPMQHSAMLLSSNARPFASIGISNPLPFESWWNLHYEIFVGRLERMENIRNGALIEPGNPLLLGTHLSVEPLTGWTIGLTRTLQFGGGSRDTSIGDVWDAFIDPVSNDNPDSNDCEEANTDACEVGNQQAAISSRMNFGGEVPFALYFEYAGEDTASFSNTRLGNLAVSGGVFFPFLFDGNWSFNYEFSEWQNSWYTHDIYLDGYSNDGVVMGHWGANERYTGSNAGARAQSFELGWQLDKNQRIELAYHQIENADYASVNYKTGEWLTARYHGPFGRHSLRITCWAGRDVFGDKIGRLEAAFIW